MKRFIIPATLFVGLFVASCSNAEKSDDDKQDSIAAAAKADSMLQAELNDTTMSDTVAKDSLFPDTLKK